jgi:hypothetical protein
MTTRILRCLVVLAAAAALRAEAHEVDATKLAAIARPDPNGQGPLLDPDGLPSLAAPPALMLSVNDYPALIAFDERIRNLATEPSVLTTVVDALPADPSRLLAFGDPLCGTIPVGGTLHRVTVVRVTSQEDCLAQLSVDPAPPAPAAPACGLGRESTALLVTTESDIASARARVTCLPQVVHPPPPPPPPEVCVAPTWTSPMTLPLSSAGRVMAIGNGATVSCDGTTWIAGMYATPENPDAPPGDVFRVDPAGGLTTISFDAMQMAVHLDGSGFLDVAGQRGGALAAVVRQLDQGGTVRWEYDPADSAPGAIDADVDGSSNVYFAYPTRTSGSGTDIALVKLTRDGTVVWTRQLGTDADDALGAIAVSPGGDLFVAGGTKGTFPGQASGGGQDAFVAHLDPAGNLDWVRQLGTVGDDDAMGVAVDPASGHVAIVGSTRGPLDGGASSGSAMDGYVAVFDGAGALQWLHELPPTTQATTAGLPFAFAQAVAIDRSGAVWVGGSTTGPSIGGAVPGTDVLVSRYDGAGALLWSRQLPAGFGANLSHIAFDAAGDGIAVVDVHQGLNHQFIQVLRLSPDGT